METNRKMLYSVACPTCFAQRGEGCKNYSGGYILSFHPARQRVIDMRRSEEVRRRIRNTKVCPSCLEETSRAVSRYLGPLGIYVNRWLCRRCAERLDKLIADGASKELRTWSKVVRENHRKWYTARWS